MENLEEAYFGGGCFWCTEAVFQRLKGVKEVIPGYAGGNGETPSYEEVSTGMTGHAEVIKVVFDPRKISYWDLLNVFFLTHDPTTENRQGYDEGTQYRSLILYRDEKQKDEAEKVKETISNSGVYSNPVITQIEPLNGFYPAEDYHRNYYLRNPSNPYCSVVISPKIGKLRSNFKNLLKE